MTKVLALADQSKIGCITQRRFAKVGTKTHPQRGADLDRNGLSVSTETACRFEPKSPVGNSEICTCSDDPLWHAIIDSETGRATGVAAYARIDRTSGVIEVGGINYSPRLQRRPAATEAMYLMMRRVFDELGYRRCEWKCDSLNAPSQSAALRLGFRYEGLFRQAVVYKGRSRDTAWFSVIDSEWPALRRGFERWLDPANFDSEGRQRASLSSLRG